MTDQPQIIELRERILKAGVSYVETVGLSLLSNDQLLRNLVLAQELSPGVAAVLWQNPDEFLTDLYVELARQARIDRADSQTLVQTWEYLRTQVSALSTAEGRRSVLIDVVRTAAAFNFQVVTTSTKWQTYAALSTTVQSWPVGESRDRVIAALQMSEHAFIGTMESFYRNVLPMVGYLLRPEFNGDYKAFVVASASVIEGLGIVRTTASTLVNAEFTFETAGESVQWSVAALAFWGVVDKFIEPDLDFDVERVSARLGAGVDVNDHP